MLNIAGKRTAAGAAADGRRTAVADVDGKRTAVVVAKHIAVVVGRCTAVAQQDRSEPSPFVDSDRILSPAMDRGRPLTVRRRQLV